jgi:hypothetical protein
MTESTSNVEFAHRVHELGHGGSPGRDRRVHRVEIVEALVLALVAVATAWSGYQAAKWDAASGRNYHMSSQLAVESQGKATLAGQDRLYDITTFNGWITARLAGNEKVSAYFERRFRPEYAAAFAAWIKLDPFENPKAPPGPIFMPEYRNANSAASAKLAAESEHFFEVGVTARERGDDYVKITVLLATVLLLTALSQRFDSFGPRVAVVVVAAILLALSLWSIVTFPRI